MEQEHLSNDFSGLKEDFDEFEASVFHKEWPLSDQIPCPECDKVFWSGVALVAHCVEVHSWEERSKRYMKQLMLNNVPDPQTMLQGLLEEYKGEKSIAESYMEPNVEKLQQVVEPNVKNLQQVTEPKVEVSLELALGSGNGVQEKVET